MPQARVKLELRLSTIDYSYLSALAYERTGGNVSECLRQLIRDERERNMTREGEGNPDYNPDVVQ